MLGSSSILCLVVISACPFLIYGQYSESLCPSQGVSSRCHCTEKVIECRNRGLTSLPPFQTSPWPFKRLDLSKNNITYIPARAFEGINVTEIDLSFNMLTGIHREAFINLKKQLNGVDLHNNLLLALPEVLSTLENITKLDVSYNPIPHDNFTDNVMRLIGDWITEFHFGDPDLQQWPHSLHHLAELQFLKFYGGKMDRIPITAFNGFEHTLRKLWMQSTHLIAVPIALQYLHNCNELHFDNNVFVKDAGILIPAFAGMTKTLDTLSLENNSLSTFPPVLRTLVSLHNLSLARNNLQIVSDQAISEVGSNLTTLNLQGCNLDRIPGALSKLSMLKNLDFSYNKITTIEKNDLQGMNHLASLNVSYNPLAYVSKSSFHDLRSLEELVLKNTSLYEVPQAITNLPHLKILNLEQDQPSIECNCDLSWLYCFTKTNNSALTIVGACYTIVLDIELYVKNDVRTTCPNMC